MIMSLLFMMIESLIMYSLMILNDDDDVVVFYKILMSCWMIEMMYSTI